LKKILTLLMVIVLSFNISFASNNQILDRAKKEYPNDIKMQQYIYEKQLSAYNYMNTVNDQEVKNMSTSEHPNDYLMQRYTYNNTIRRKKLYECCLESEN